MFESNFGSSCSSWFSPQSPHLMLAQPSICPKQPAWVEDSKCCLFRTSCPAPQDRSIPSCNFRADRNFGKTVPWLENIKQWYMGQIILFFVVFSCTGSTQLTHDYILTNIKLPLSQKMHITLISRNDQLPGASCVWTTLAILWVEAKMAVCSICAALRKTSFLQTVRCPSSTQHCVMIPCENLLHSVISKLSIFVPPNHMVHH